MAMRGSLSPSRCNKPILDDSSGVVRLVREQPPEHCILKVESFSVLKDALSRTDKDHLNSTKFEAGGYTWVLSVYPKGNKQEDGDGHLSLYVALVDKLNRGTYVKVALRFFIYDQLRDNYLTVLDIRDKCFHAEKTTWGIPKVMSLESFTDVSNGFLINDCCVFGAEVLLRDGHTKRSVVSVLESKSDRIYTWKIENFSDLSKSLYSPEFSFGEWSWKLFLFPRGNEESKGKSISLYLYLANANDLSDGSILYTQFCLFIKKQGLRADYKKTAHVWFPTDTHDFGYSSFLSLSDLYNTSKGFLVDDTLILEVNIEVMLLLKDTNPTLQKIGDIQIDKKEQSNRFLRDETIRVRRGFDMI